MPLDALCLAAVREELSEKIVGSKIDKVQQPERDVIILSLRGHSFSLRLLLCAGSGDMRVHLTEHRFENPDSPPMFCMLLRKHIAGARIIEIKQPPAERVLEFVLEAPDAFGVSSRKHLIIELIARSANIILTDGDGIILDCLRRIGGELSDRRSVLPGMLYRFPPIQEGKIDPQTMDDDKWEMLYKARSGDMTVEKWLISTFSAFSPLICREIAWRAYGDCDFRIEAVVDEGEALRERFFEIINIANERMFEPWHILAADDMPRDFSYVNIKQYEDAFDVRREVSFSAMLDGHYTRVAQIARLRQRSSVILKTVKNAKDRVVRKLAAQQSDLEKTALRDSLRECGDIITANMHLMKKGQRVLIAPDFYAQGDSTREIILDPKKTPQQNAAKYYKDYTKAKTAEKFLKEQIASGLSEAEYIDSVLEAIARAEGDRDMDEIRRELVQTGYMMDKAPRGGKMRKPPASSPMLFESSSGMQIRAGRNNVQNDALTLKSAMRADVWLHAQKIHGSHVVISCEGQQPDDVTLYESAVIAAVYSEARSDGKISVDYTSVRNVKRQPGGRPGMVVYTGFKTIIVSPDVQLVERLRKL